MKLTYRTDKVLLNEDLLFPLGRIAFFGHKNHCLYLGSRFIDQDSSAHLSEAEVIAILSEVVSRTNGRIRVEFEDVTLEFE